MEFALIVKIGVLLVGFYMAWNIGANDVSNAMGTSVGSGALTLRRAVIIAALLEFAGAFLVGSNVSETMQKGLIDTTLFAQNIEPFIIGMCGALLGTGIWLQIASYFGLPVSTTHAIVGAIIGFGTLIGGVGAIQWGEVGSIALSWIISPALSGFVSYLLFSILQRNILFAMNPTAATKRLIPFYVFAIFTTFIFGMTLGGLRRLNVTFTFAESLMISSSIGLLAALIAYVVVKRLTTSKEKSLRPASRQIPFALISLEKAIKHLRRVRASSGEENRVALSDTLKEMHAMADKMRLESPTMDKASQYATVEKWFAALQIISACCVAFAHGANDVANAIGPVAAVLEALKKGALNASAPIPSWLLAFGGLGIVLGLATWGWRVIETIGKKITELTPTRGFCAEFGAALTILFASKLGLPISTTHCLVGAVLGVGMARGIRALNLNTLKEIALSWVITLPASALMSIICFYLLKLILI